MAAMTIWTAEKVRVGRIGNKIILPPDDMQTPWIESRHAFRKCANGILRLHAARTLLGKAGVWWALILRPADDGCERAWFYLDEGLCRDVYSTWAGYGDPDGFVYSPSMYEF